MRTVSSFSFGKKFDNPPMKSMDAIMTYIWRRVTATELFLPKWWGYKGLSKNVSHDQLNMWKFSKTDLHTPKKCHFGTFHQVEKIIFLKLWTKYRGCRRVWTFIKLHVGSVHHPRVVCLTPYNLNFPLFCSWHLRAASCGFSTIVNKLTMVPIPFWGGDCITSLASTDPAIYQRTVHKETQLLLTNCLKLASVLWVYINVKQ